MRIRNTDDLTHWGCGNAMPSCHTMQTSSPTPGRLPATLSVRKVMTSMCRFQLYFFSGSTPASIYCNMCCCGSCKFTKTHVPAPQFVRKKKIPTDLRLGRLGLNVDSRSLLHISRPSGDDEMVIFFQK